MKIVKYLAHHARTPLKVVSAFHQREISITMFTSDWLGSPPSLPFKVQMSKFYQERIPKAAKSKTIPT